MANIAVSLNSLAVGTTQLSAVSSIDSSMIEPLYLSAFSSVTSIRQISDSDNRVSITTPMTAFPTYSKTDGEEIITTVSAAGGGTYWITG